MRLALSVFLPLWLALVPPAFAANPAAPAGTCAGQDLMAGLSAADRAALVGDAPFAYGNFWTATRGPTHLTIAGTYHLDDPRFDAVMPHLAPLLKQAQVLMVEAGPAELDELKTDMIKHPERMIITSGKTLPEALPEAEWQKLSTAMRARGMPPFMVSKFQPWYVATLLAIPPCAMTGMAKGGQGLDSRLITLAEANHTPIHALEPFDTAFRLFDQMSRADQLDMLRVSVAGVDVAQDMATTLADAYFAGAHRLIWEFDRRKTLQEDGPDAAAGFDTMEKTLLIGRNHAWMKVLLPETDGKTAFVAVGAAHLGGPDGVLKLLQDQGFTVTRLGF